MSATTDAVHPDPDVRTAGRSGSFGRLRRGVIGAMLALVAGMLALPTALLDPAGAAASTTAAQASPVDTGVFHPPDVLVKFNALSERAEALGFALGEASDPSVCRHY